MKFLRNLILASLLLMPIASADHGVKCLGQCQSAELKKYAHDWMDSFSNEMAAILENPELATDLRVAEMKRVLSAYFHIPYIASQTLPANLWKQLSKPKQKDFIDFFSDYLATTFEASMGKLAKMTFGTMRIQDARNAHAIGVAEQSTGEKHDLSINIYLTKENKYIAWDLKAQGTSYIILRNKTNFTATTDSVKDFSPDRRVDFLESVLSCQIKQPEFTAVQCLESAKANLNK